MQIPPRFGYTKFTPKQTKRIHKCKVQYNLRLHLQFAILSFTTCLVYQKNLTNEVQAFLKILIRPLLILRASIENQEASIKVRKEPREEIKLNFDVKVEAREEQKLDFNVKVEGVEDLLFTKFINTLQTKRLGGSWRGFWNCNHRLTLQSQI